MGGSGEGEATFEAITKAWGGGTLCEENGWDFDGDLYIFPSPLALGSLHLGLKSTLCRLNQLSLPPDIGGKLINLVLDLGLKSTLYR